MVEKQSSGPNAAPTIAAIFREGRSAVPASGQLWWGADFGTVLVACALRLGIVAGSIAIVVGHDVTQAQEKNARSIPTISTMSYERPIELEAGGQSIHLEGHSAPRFHDWDLDQDLDVLVGGGDGRLWLFRNQGTPKKPLFQAQEPIQAGDRDRWGNSFTGLVLANLVGTELPDLIVCHSGSQLTIHENIGTAGNPKFAESAVTIQVQDQCQGRFDLADWDGDGAADLVTGSFGGRVEWHRNRKNERGPKFDAGEPFADLSVAYNSHPRIVDFNQDGRLDLLLGVNWGTVSLYLNSGNVRAPSLNGSRQLQWSDGSDLSIRELNGDDSTPEVADLDGDGVLDLISGGRNGRLFFMRGIGFPSRVATIQTLLARHGREFGQILREDENVRQQAFGALVSLQADLGGGLIPSASREQLFEQLAPLAKQYPELLGRSKYDLTTTPHLPLLSGQYWTVLLESLPDSEANRGRVAEALGFSAGYRRLLVDHGVLLIDNDTATPEHLEAMHQLMTAIPRAVWDVETITVAGWLGPAIKTLKIHSRTGINIFALPLGRPENSFPGDAPRPGITDVYMICLAHELAHNMLDTVGRRTRPELYERKFAGLSQAAGPQVVYKAPKSAGIDMVATKKTFQAIGAWNGEESTWNEAWTRFFAGKDNFDRAYTRGNVQFFLDAPQEAFATLANQYFADSQLMLDFCRGRWNAGHPSNINQFLLIADYLSAGTNTVNFYVLRPGGDLTLEPVQLTRDAQGRIAGVQSKNSTAIFGYDQDDLVNEFRMESIQK